MARVVLIVDSRTGALIDVAGNVREGGRYYMFAKRMLSLDKNPLLDYGANGGDSLEISNGGSPGKKIALKADVVEVSGSMTVGGRPLDDYLANIDSLIDRVSGVEGEISVTPTVKQDDPTHTYLLIGLAPEVVERLDVIDEAIEASAGFVKKSDIMDVVRDLQVGDDDTLDEVKGTLRVLISRLTELAAGSS